MTEFIIAYSVLTTITGFGPVLWLEDHLLKGMPPRAGNLAGGMLWLLGSVTWPFFIVWLLWQGAKLAPGGLHAFGLAWVELYRHFFPKKVSIPEARVVK